MTETPSIPAPESEGSLPAGDSEPAGSGVRGRWRDAVPWPYLAGLTAICLVGFALLAVAFRGSPGTPAVAPTIPAPTSTPIESAAACAGDIDFAAPVNGTGWSVPEVAQDGRTYVWTTATDSTIALDPGIARPVELDARIYMAMAPDILESVRISANGREVPTEIATDDNGVTTIRASIGPDNAGAAQPVTEIGVSIDRTMAPDSADDRTLGVAFDEIRFICAADGANAAATPRPVDRPGSTPVSPARATAVPVLDSTGTPTANLVCPPRRAENPAAASQPCLSADPNPVPMAGERGFVTIGWSIGDAPPGTPGRLYVAKDGRPEQLFLTGRRGTTQARIRGGSVYEFRLYSGANRDQLLASVIVSTS